jgi:hypothetical protein
VKKFNTCEDNQQATKIGNFKLKIPEMSWASSAAFILDGAKIIYPSGKKIVSVISLSSRERW